MSKALQRLRWYETAEDCPDYCTILDDIRAGADELDALVARCAELEANLLHYGAHMVACDFIQDTLKCSCGFEDIRKRLSGTPSGKP